MTLQIDDEKFFGELGRVASAVGTKPFYELMLDCVGMLFPWEINMVMRYSQHSQPTYMVAGSSPKYIFNLYQSGYYRLDPYYNYWRTKSRGGVLTIREASPGGTETSDYFNFFLPKTQMLDDLGIMLPVVGGAAVGLFYERKTFFEQEELDRVRKLFPALNGLHRAHQRSLLSSISVDSQRVPDKVLPTTYKIIDHEGRAVYASNAWLKAEEEAPGLLDFLGSLMEKPEHSPQSTPFGLLSVERLDEEFLLAPGGWLCALDRDAAALPPIPFQEATDSFLPDQLTPRERQIVELVLSGYPNSKIAEKLEISEGTIKNHRKRLYYKLDITTERELFLQFLEHLSAAGVSADVTP